jgi:hypothetical protein
MSVADKDGLSSSNQGSKSIDTSEIVTGSNLMASNFVKLNLSILYFGAQSNATLLEGISANQTSEVSETPEVFS